MFKELAQQLDLAFLAEPWLPQATLVLAATLAINIAAYALLRRAELHTRKTSSLWDDAIFQAIHRPLRYLIWLVSLAMILDIAGRGSELTLFEYIPSIRNVGVIICLAWFLIQLTDNVTENIVARHEQEGAELDRTTLDALSKLARLTVFIVALLVVMQTLGFSLSGVLAAGGIGGIALGFAAKDLLANFFGGLTVYLDRPFSVGDWIRSPDKAIEGTVEHISWRHTRIRGFNKNPIYVPNALFTNIVVENPSRMSHRRIKANIGIRYADLHKVEPIVADIKAMLIAHPDIDDTQTLIVNFNEFAASSLDIFIYSFTQTTAWVDFQTVKQDVLLKIAAIIAAHDAEIAFPTQTLHIEQIDTPPPL